MTPDLILAALTVAAGGLAVQLITFTLRRRADRAAEANLIDLAADARPDPTEPAPPLWP